MAYGSKKIGVPPPEAVGFKSRVRATISASQDVAQDTTTIVNFDSVSEDGLGEFDNANYRFIPKEDGLYLIVAHIIWEEATVEADKTSRIGVFKNGFCQSFENRLTSHVEWFSSTITAYHRLKKGDKITIRVSHSGTATWQIRPSADGSNLRIQRIA